MNGLHQLRRYHLRGLSALPPNLVSRANSVIEQLAQQRQVLGDTIQYMRNRDFPDDAIRHAEVAHTEIVARIRTLADQIPTLDPEDYEDWESRASMISSDIDREVDLTRDRGGRASQKRTRLIVGVTLGLLTVGGLLTAAAVYGGKR